MSEDLTVISTFAGCGGSSLGYRMAGLKVRLACEWDAHAVQCYRLNHPHTPVFHGDVARLSTRHALELSGLEPGELDVFDGSPPCQGFSTAGRRQLDDPRNTLFREYVRLLRGLRPRCFVMENVRGMVIGKMKWVFVQVLKELKSCGYDVKCRLLNAMHYDVPQHRQRIIFVGVRDDLAALGIEPSHPIARCAPIPLRDVLPALRMIQSTSDRYHRKVFPGTGPGPTLTKTPDGYEGIEEPVLLDGYESTRRRNGRSPAAGTGNAPAPTLRKGRPLQLGSVGSGATHRLAPSRQDGDGFNYRDLNPGDVAPALTSASPGNDVGLVEAAPSAAGSSVRRRALTITEAKIIQSMPVDFILTGSYQKQWARIGNSVPPLLMRAIAESIRDDILAKVPGREAAAALAVQHAETWAGFKAGDRGPDGWIEHG